MPLTLSLPAIDARPANPPEIRPAKVFPWLDEQLKRAPIDAAGTIGDSLAAINRAAMSDSRRLELAERYWAAATLLWPDLEKAYVRASHPLTGEALAAAKSALGLATELSIAYKHLLAREADRRIYLTGHRLLVALIHRNLQCTARILTNSYLSYSPVPAKTWLDAHAVYAFARERDLHLSQIATDLAEVTPERVYLQALLLALANPYGFRPGQLDTVIHYLNEYSHCAKLTDVAPVHRMAKAVAIVPVGHDFPPFSANKGGASEGAKIFLLTYDLAFQIQEQLRKFEAGGDVPKGVGRGMGARLQYIALLKRLLRQWAIPPTRQFNRLPSRARVVICAGLSAIWQYSRGTHAGIAHAPTGLPDMTHCQVINHTAGGYALRQTDAHPTALRIGDIIALRVEGRSGLQIAIVRWFRNTLRAAGLELGCELIADDPEAAGARAEDGSSQSMVPVVVIPEDAADSSADAGSPQIIVPVGSFGLEQAVSLRRGNETGVAVLTKLVEQGPGFELYEYAPIG